MEETNFNYHEKEDIDCHKEIYWDLYSDPKKDGIHYYLERNDSS